jgi:O-antigen/teichoic acid export membrane protein
VLLIFIGPAFLANLLVYYFTARILSAENFGLFYVAVTIGNVAFSGSLVLNIFFTRYLVQIGATEAGNTIAATRRIQRVVAFWGAIVSLAVVAMLAGLSRSFGAQSPLVVLLIVADTYASYLADLGRAFLQSRRQTWQLGCFTFIWMALRLAFCVLGSAAFGTVWAALLGSASAAVLVIIGFQFLMAHAARRDPSAITARDKPPKLPGLTTLLPVALGYGLLMAISNLDVLLIYFLLKDQEIGVYSASSVFPKGILVVTMPVSQMLFAMMMGDHASDHVFRTVVRKTMWVIAALTVAAAFSVWLASPWLCGGSFGLTLCAPAPLHVLLVSAVILCVLRMTVLLEFVRQRDWLILSLIVPTSVYLLVAWRTKPELDQLAVQFTFFTGVTLVFFTAVQWGAARWCRADAVRQR